MAVVTRIYEGHAIAYRDDGWFNATQAAAKYGKEPAQWARLPATVEYIDALRRKYGEITYLQTRRGKDGGTWMHPKLGVLFARWLSVDFAVWCDEQVDEILRGKDEWRISRNGCASSNKVVNEMLTLIRSEKGKATEPHHYMNEAKLVNHVISGEFKGLDRNSLSRADLDLLAHIEMRNAVLIGRDIPYDQRKSMLRQYAMDWRIAHTPALES